MFDFETEAFENEQCKHDGFGRMTGYSEVTPKNAVLSGWATIRPEPARNESIVPFTKRYQACLTIERKLDVRASG